jgi:hypothetical protein
MSENRQNLLDQTKIKESVPGLEHSDSTSITSLQACKPKVAIDMLVFILHLSRPGSCLGLDNIYYDRTIL